MVFLKVMPSYNKKYRRVSVKSRLKAMIFKFIFLFLTCVAFIGFVYIPKFRLKNIAAQSDSNLKSQVEKIAADKLSEKKLFILPRDNFFLFNKKWLSNEIAAALPKVKNIYFDRDFPNALIIKFDEKKEVALWCGTEEKCYLLDEDGVVMQKDIYFSDGVWNSIPKFKDLRINNNNNSNQNDKIINKEKLNALLKFLNGVNGAFQTETKEILVYDAKYEIYFNEGWFAVLDDKTNFDLAFDNLKLIFNSKMKTKEKRKNLEYIDLRLENKAFLKRK